MSIFKRVARQYSRHQQAEIDPTDDETKANTANKVRRELKGILKPPTPRFPEELNPVREGVALHTDDEKRKDAPPGARWTKISRKLVSKEALVMGKERFEAMEDSVIVLRVLNKKEIEAYMIATHQLRARRRREHEAGRVPDLTNGPGTGRNSPVPESPRRTNY